MAERQLKWGTGRHPLLTGCLHVLLNLCNKIPNLGATLRLLETKRIIHAIRLGPHDQCFWNRYKSRQFHEVQVGSLTLLSLIDVTRPDCCTEDCCIEVGFGTCN